MHPQSGEGGVHVLQLGQSRMFGIRIRVLGVRWWEGLSHVSRK